MQPRDLSPDAPGELVQNIDGNLSYVPNPLPPDIRWDIGLIDVSHRATQAVAQLCGVGARFPEPQRLIRLFLRREAELSSRIEQTHASVRTLLLDENAVPIDDGQKADAAREVSNNYNVLRVGIETVRDRPVTLSLLRGLHSELFRGLEARQVNAGRFRSIPVFIGHTDHIDDARFVPPPPLHVLGCMESLERYVRDPDRTPAIVRAAVAHYQFEVIHPFNDGNGRIGRALIMMMLVHEGLLPIPLLNPSAGLERRRRQYYDALLGVSLKGEWENWIKLFCTAVLEEAQHTTELLNKLDDLRLAFHKRIRKTRSIALLTPLVDELFATPAQTATTVAQTLSVTLPTAYKAIAQLESLGVLSEVTGRERDRVFMATEIVDLFSDPPSKPPAARKRSKK